MSALQVTSSAVPLSTVTTSGTASASTVTLAPLVLPTIQVPAHR